MTIKKSLKLCKPYMKTGNVFADTQYEMTNSRRKKIRKCKDAQIKFCSPYSKISGRC